MSVVTAPAGQKKPVQFSTITASSKRKSFICLGGPGSRASSRGFPWQRCSSCARALRFRSLDHNPTPGRKATAHSAGASVPRAEEHPQGGAAECLSAEHSPPQGGARQRRPRQASRGAGVGAGVAPTSPVMPRLQLASAPELSIFFPFASLLEF